MPQSIGITKICSHCREILPLSEFWKNRTEKDGLQNTCINCCKKRKAETPGAAAIYARNYRRSRDLYKPYNENKSCSSYLGVHVAERLLSTVFSNVIPMPWGNIGYDFICGKGFKVDVKSACLRPHTKTSSCWEFSIKQNKVADYFACLAFDNRISLTPLHFWIVPGYIINTLQGLHIQNSKKVVAKWAIYEKPIDKLITGCKLLRMVA